MELRERGSTGRRWLAATAVAGAVIAGVAVPAVAAQAAEAHQDNPFTGATQYVNPLWRAEVQGEAAGAEPAAAAKMQAVANTPTSVWLDSIGAIAGPAGGMGLAAHLDAALTQKTSAPEVFNVVVYDLPGRDCNALASNGELPATAAGLARYETDYIDPIAAILGQPKYAGLRIVATIEPDSLPNIVTNQGVAACQTAGPLYEQGVAYTLGKLHALSNVYSYLDMGHSGWLGWSSNSGPAATEFAKVAKSATGGVATVDGFVSDTANTTPLKEPFFTGTTAVGGQQVIGASAPNDFYQWNPDVDEASFTADMYPKLVAAGFPTGIGMLIDTSRNGWGGSARPTAPSTSTDAGTFVSASKVDKRPDRGAWCNAAGAGLGERPQASPAGYPDSHLDAFVWVKPPGESDGASTDIPNNEGKRFDRMCDPTYAPPGSGWNGRTTGALPNAPLSGQWFGAQFDQLVANAYPAIEGQAGTDAIAPSVPSGLTMTASTATSVSLAWTASSDNVGVTAYDVYRGGTKVGTVTGTSFTDAGLSASTAYSYTVKARDAAGNTSAASAVLAGSTPAGGDAGTTTCDPQGLIELPGGGYDVQANEWNSADKQCITSTSDTAWSVSTANFGLPVGGPPATYPSIFKGCHWGECTSGSNLPIQVDKLATAKSSWNTTQVPSGAYDVAYDLWTNSAPTTTGQPDGSEIMIWLNSRGGVQPFGSKTATATIGGLNWDVWTGQQTSWKIVSYVLQGGTSAVNGLDVKALLDDSVARGSTDPNHYLIDAEAGFEIWQGGQGLATNSFSFDATQGTSSADTQPPTTPAGLSVSGTTSSSASLTWSASSDNVGVTGYDVYRGGAKVGTATGTSYTDTGLAGSTGYSYTVKAHDAAGNVSAASAAVTATTTSGGVALLSQGHNAWASSSESGTTTPAMAVDGDTGTRWSSSFQDNQWLNVDLGATHPISKIVLNWEAAYATGFKVQTSNDPNFGTWTDLYSTTTGTGGVMTLPVSGSGRYVRLLGQTHATAYGFSLYELQVFGT